MGSSNATAGQILQATAAHRHKAKKPSSTTGAPRRSAARAWCQSCRLKSKPPTLANTSMPSCGFGRLTEIALSDNGGNAGSYHSENLIYPAAQRPNPVSTLTIAAAGVVLPIPNSHPTPNALMPSCARCIPPVVPLQVTVCVCVCRGSLPPFSDISATSGPLSYLIHRDGIAPIPTSTIFTATPAA